MMPVLESRMTGLVDWVKSCGGALHPLVKITLSSTYGWIFTVDPCLREPLPASTSILTVPQSVTMSCHDASSLNPCFPARFLNALDYPTIGAFFLVHEFLLGTRSKWWPYIATLPQPQDMDEVGGPEWFDDDDAAWLAGTNLDGSRDEFRRSWKRDWEKGIMFLERGKFEDAARYTWDLFRWSTFIFSSRAFRSSLTFPALNAPVAADPTSVDIPVLIPLFDLTNHCPAAKVSWVPHDSSHAIPQSCTFLVSSPVDPGAQIFNNYGFKSNAELLLSYGFCIEHNSCDEVALKITFPPGSALFEAKKRQARLWTGDEGRTKAARDGAEVYYVRAPQHPKGYAAEWNEKGEGDAALSIFPRRLFDDLCLLFASPAPAPEDLQISKTSTRLRVDDDDAARLRLRLKCLVELDRWLGRLRHKMDDADSTHRLRASTPRNLRQRNAKFYRDGQKELMDMSIAILQDQIRRCTEAVPHGLEKIEY